MNKLAFVTALILTSCSQSAGIPVSGADQGIYGHIAPTGVQTNLYVQGRTEIVEYTRQGKLVRTIALSTRPVPGGGLAFDSSGYLYATSGYFSVSVFSPGSRQLVRSITNGIFEPFTLAVDRSDNLYVANGHNGYGGNVAVFPPGSSTASRTITEGIYDPESLAFDSAGNLYVGNGLYTDTVTVYSPSGALLRTISEGVGDPESIALDRHDNLFVANTEDGSGRTVTVYGAGTNKLLQTIAEGIKCPQALALDSMGQLYVANNAKGTATVYAAKTRKLLRTITKGITLPWVIAVDSANKLYVGSEEPTDHISIYRPGHTRPARTIQSNDTWIPLTLAFGPP